MKKRKKLNWKIPLLVVLVLLLVLLLGFEAHLRRTHSVQQPQTTDPSEPTVSGMTDPVEQTVSATDDSAPKGFEPIELGDGIVLTGLAEATGNFPEDGSDEFLLSMLSATFRNDSGKTLQYCKVKLNIDDTDYNFEFSTLPPGKTVRAFDMNKNKSPQSIGGVEASTEYMVFFPEEPQCHEDRFQITVESGTITVKNISGEDIPGEISVFYKNVYSGVYMGGITYRLRINGLKAGEEISGYASHAQKNVSEIMFVTYGNS